ncbi:MAG: hypothetical protein ABWW66_04485 [Archaeoglobaceae archaeon]
MKREIKIVIPLPTSLLPEEAANHMLNAAKEFLLALRAIIDASIEKIDEIESVAKEKKDIEKVEIE